LLTADVSPRILAATSAASGLPVVGVRGWTMTYKDWGALIGFTIGVLAFFL